MREARERRHMVKRTIKSALVEFVSAAIGFLLISLFFFSLAIYYGRLNAADGPDPRSTFLFHFARFFPLAVLTPVIFALGRRWPLFGPKWKTRLMFHLGTGVVFSALHLCMTYGLMELGLAMGWITFHLLTFRDAAIIFYHYNFLFYWIILFLGFMIEYRRKYRERELRASRLEAQLAQANLKVLKMQVHPHFLYNTLHAISTLVYENPEAAELTIIRLSELLRLTLEHKGDQEIAVSEEMEYLGLYLEIMKTRFAERFNVSLEVDPDALRARIPAFLLQPLVENAIQHAVLPREEGGRVVVRAGRHQSILVLDIEDNGPGFTAEPAAVGKGFGLAYTEERLRCAYGEGYGLKLTNRAEGGAHVRVEIPFSTAASPAPVEERVARA
jgi:two-component system LytT family sensor kinase